MNNNKHSKSSNKIELISSSVNYKAAQFRSEIRTPTSQISPIDDKSSISEKIIMDSIKTPEELYMYMKNNIKYGFYSKDFNRTYIRSKLQNDYLYEYLLFNNYYLQKPSELLKTKVGICYDQVELEREWFTSHGYKVYTFYCTFHNHSFLVYEFNGKYYYFERTIKKFNGIHEGDSLKDILKKYKTMQLSDRNFEGFKLYEYKEVTFGTGFYNFIYQSSNGEINRIGRTI